MSFKRLLLDVPARCSSSRAGTAHLLWPCRHTGGRDSAPPWQRRRSGCRPGSGGGRERPQAHRRRAAGSPQVPPRTAQWHSYCPIQWLLTVNPAVACADCWPRICRWHVARTQAAITPRTQVREEKTKGDRELMRHQHHNMTTIGCWWVQDMQGCACTGPCAACMLEF